MPLDRDHHRRRTCRRKIRYGSPLAAWLRFIDLGSEARTLPYRIYECEQCGGLHIGGPRRYRRQVAAKLSDHAGRAIIQRLVRRMGIAR